MSEAKKYDRSYKEQSVKLALEIGVKRASEELDRKSTRLNSSHPSSSRMPSSA